MTSRPQSGILSVLLAIFFLVLLAGGALVFYSTRLSFGKSGLKDTGVSVSDGVAALELQWERVTIGKGLSVELPPGWDVIAWESINAGDTTERAYTISNVKLERPSEVRASGQHVHMRFLVYDKPSTETKSDLLRHLNRYPPDSTHLFTGSTPAVFTEEKFQIGGNEAIRFLLDEESREREKIFEWWVINLGDEKSLRIADWMLPHSRLNEDEVEAYARAKQRVIESVRPGTPGLP